MVDKPSPHGARRDARRLLVQALYQWQLAGHDGAELKRQFRKQVAETDTVADDDVPDGKPLRPDWDYFDDVLDGVLIDHAQIDALIDPLLDRPLMQIDPVEHAVLLLAAEELRNHLEIPYRVVINEAVTITREFGAEGAHGYINGVLDKLAVELRAVEKQAVV